MKNFAFKREWMEEMAALPDDFRARIVLAATEYAYFGKRPADPIVAFAMRHIIAYIDRRNAAEMRRKVRKSEKVAAPTPVEATSAKQVSQPETPDFAEVTVTIDADSGEVDIPQQPQLATAINQINHALSLAEDVPHQPSLAPEKLEKPQKPMRQPVKAQKRKPTMTFRDLKRQKRIA